jgi:DNA polymerase
MVTHKWFNEMNEPELFELGRIVLQRLESLQRAGVETVGKPDAAILPAALFQSTAPGSSSVPSSTTNPTTSPPTTSPTSRFQLQPSKPSVSTPSPPLAAQESAMPPRTKSAPVVRQERHDLNFSGDRAAMLAQLKCVVEQCTLCKELVKTRSQTVFGVGNIQPRVVFFGEAPGADEDRQGEPFVGRSGQLLTKIIEACGFQRSDVFIMNVCKCRPPDNRTPTEEEMENCRPFFEKQLEVLTPEYIVCVGATPMKALFPTSKSIGQMRGKFHDYQGKKVIITYHPAYLLRNPDAKKFVWDDMKMMLTDMGLPIPSQKST